MRKLFFRKILRKYKGRWRVLLSNPPLSYEELRPSDLLSTEEILDLFGVSQRQIYRWIQNGSLVPYMKVSGEYLFRKEDVDRFRQVRRPPGRPPNK